MCEETGSKKEGLFSGESWEGWRLLLKPKVSVGLILFDVYMKNNGQQE